jgi:hypothetical protein
MSSGFFVFFFRLMKVDESLVAEDFEREVFIREMKTSVT